MTIGIDARNLEGNKTGVGRVLFNIIKVWATTDQELKYQIKFILYFKDQIPGDLPNSSLFELKLLGVKSTAKFIHWDLWRAVKKDKVDVLFCPEYVGPIFYKGKIAVLLHDISYEAHPEWFNWPSPADKILLKWVSKKIAQKAKIVFVPVEFVKNEVIKYYKIPEERIIVIGEGVDPALSVLAGEIMPSTLDNIKQRFGIKNDFIFYIGQIFSRRHLPEVINAYVKVCGNRPDWQLLLAGKDRTDGRAIDMLVRKTNQNIGRDAILRIDFIPDSDLKLLYSACAFFVWLSDYEGFGLPPLEAMSLGAPVITSDNTSLKEVAGGATLLIKNNQDVEEIYMAMKNLCDDEKLRAGLIEKGKEQAKKFSWEKCAEKTLEALLKA